MINICHIVIIPQIALSIPAPPPVVEVDPNAVKITGNDVITYNVIMCDVIIGYVITYDVI